MKTDINLWYRVRFFLEWEMFQAKVVEKIKTAMYDNVEKYGRSTQATHDSTIGACALRIG